MSNNGVLTKYVILPPPAGLYGSLLANYLPISLPFPPGESLVTKINGTAQLEELSRSSLHSFPNEHHQKKIREKLPCRCSLFSKVNVSSTVVVSFKR